MTAFDREMQRALLADAQKLRDMGVECADPIFFSTEQDEQRATIETPGKVIDLMAALKESLAAHVYTFPRAESRYSTETYYGLYRNAHAATMKAWIVQEFKPLSEFDLPKTEAFAIHVAEVFATDEMGRSCNTHESRLIGEAIRDLYAVRFAERDTEQARQAELSREVL